MELNRPEVVAEVAARFERYEQALVDNDVAMLDASFWDSPYTVRYGPRDNGHGFAAIHASRLAAVPIPGGSKQARLRLEILTLGMDFATVNLDYVPRGQDGIGRQSQTWVRLPGVGWRIVAAHVSIIRQD